MDLIIKGLKKNTNFLLLLLIFLIGIFLRFYQSFERFDFAHDGDLYSWFVKDVLVNNHLRLIGQMTSTPGIFIGPAFYYLIIPFFLLTQMEPTGTIYFATILGGLTIVSFFIVFRKLFDNVTGLIAASLQAFLLSRVYYDRWVVPTVLSSIWEIWYFYTVVSLVRGNYQVFFLLGLLIGLVWHISFVLAPTLLAVPVAIFLAKKRPSFKNIYLGFLGLIISSLPLIIFETRHNFSQTQAFLGSFLIDQQGDVGWLKFLHILSMVSGNAYQLIFYPERGIEVFRLLLFFVLLCLGFLIAFKSSLNRRLMLILAVWVFGVLLFFSISSKIITEYYFISINMVIIAILIIGLKLIYQKQKFGKIIVILIIFGIMGRGVDGVVFHYYYNSLGYQERKAVVSYIADDAKRNNYPCIAISYIIPKLGDDFGFRYLFYLYNLHINHPGSGSPIYSIVVPESLASSPNKVRFGAYGLIPEGSNKSSEEISETCKGSNLNLTESLFGFTE